jgi:hypothetical protein
MKIDKDIPVPESTRARKWPFIEMDIGDSVFFAEEQVNGKAYRAAMSVGRRQHRKYVARREDEGLRIWRSE